MLRIIFTSLVLVTAVAVQAQQLPLFSQYREQTTLINPAIINADRAVLSFMPTSKAVVSYRNQWGKLGKEAPRTFTAQYEHILEDANMTLGGAVTRDQTGPTSSVGVSLRYAYQIKFSNEGFLSLGLSTGFAQFRYLGHLGIFKDPGDDIGFTDNSRMLFETNLGAYYQTELNNYDIFYAGVSVPQGATADLGGSGEASADFRLRRVPHYYAQAGYYKYLGEGIGNRSIFIEPSVWLKTAQNVPTQTDLNLRFQAADLFWIGGGMSFSVLDKFHRDNAHIEAGITVADDYFNSGRCIKIGVGYDTNITPYGSYLGSAFEINLTYAWER